jgi:hypothetical protein
MLNLERLKKKLYYFHERMWVKTAEELEHEKWDVIESWYNEVDWKAEDDYNEKVWNEIINEEEGLKYEPDDASLYK